MHLDGLTLMAAGSFVTAVSGFLLLGAWTHMRRPALLWWAASSGVGAFAVALMAFGMATANDPVIAVAVGLYLLSPALVWNGVRRFNHRKTNYPLLGAGLIVWLAASLLPLPGPPNMIATAVSFAVWVAYLGAAIGELWRSRAEPLMARWPLAGFLGLHAFIFLGGIVDTLAGNIPSGMVQPLTSWFSLIHFDSFIYAIGTAVFMVLMCQQRIEYRHISAARSDSLTGIASRGGLLENAQRALRRCQSDGISFSLILFDLDRFKRVNDTFGHDVGDDVLRKFADITRSVLRPNDIFGRYGGEEFIVVLPSATIEAAYVIADRIRHKFAETSTFLGERRLEATVSGGVASATSTTTLETIIREADLSMYEAKRLGRNRVERAPHHRQSEIEMVVRIA